MSTCYFKEHSMQTFTSYVSDTLEETTKAFANYPKVKVGTIFIMEDPKSSVKDIYFQVVSRTNTRMTLKEIEATDANKPIKNKFTSNSLYSRPADSFTTKIDGTESNPMFFSRPKGESIPANGKVYKY